MSMNTDKQLRGVGVGAGYFSQFHYEAWSRIPQVEIVGICDQELTKAETLANQYGVQNTSSNLEKLLDETEPDFIDVITRPDSHAAIVELAASRGIDVICQKPLAPTIEEAVQLVESADASGIRLMVHENFRFQPWHREIHRLINEGTIGDQLLTLSCRTRTGDGWQSDAYLARQPYFVEMPRFLIYETGVHFVDTFRYHAGEIEGVFASLRKLNQNIRGEDAGVVLFEFANQAEGIWDASRFHESNCSNPRYTFGDFLFDGSAGSIRLSGDGTIRIQPHGEPEFVHNYQHSDRNFAGDCVFYTQQHFIHGLLEQRPFETDGREYLKTLRVQEAIYESARTGQPVRQLSSGGHNASC